MTVLETVLVGVLSSLVATFIFLHLSWLVKTILIPWYEDRIYRGVRINGHWTIQELAGIDAEQLDEVGTKATIDIKQNGDQVTGLYSHSNIKSDDVATYKFKGEIRNSYLSATSWPIADDHIDAGAYVLRVFSHGGLRMKGVVTYISNDGIVNSCTVEFKKKDS